ncbi:MAG: helix-turn-helix domain-containing protein [Candidatus Roseilinea sp.]|uniref:helix-turn-helix domain-containing protein n=1 Tax=Candidatus Roseilinea sp. TaxID=2838777 RepID=UPI00404AB3BB
MSLGIRLQVWRHALGLTQDGFAQRAGIPKKTLVGYENEDRVPRASALAAIAKTGVNLHWLVTGEGSMSAQTENALGRAPSKQRRQDARLK